MGQAITCAFGFSGGGSSSGGITGAGTPPRMPKFTSPTEIGDSQMADNGTTVFIGASATSTSAMFEVNSTAQGALFPRMTTTQRDLIPVGATEDSLFIYNTSSQKFNYYDTIAGAWITVESSIIGGETWAGTLSNGAISGGVSPLMSNGDVIKAVNGGGQLDLRAGADGSFNLTSDNGGFTQGWIGGDITAVYMGFGVTGNFIQTATSSSLVRFDSGDVKIASVGGNVLLQSANANSVGIGTATPTNRLDIVGDTGVTSRMGVTRYSNNLAGGGISLVKSRGTESTPLATLSGDNLGYITGGGYDGTSFTSQTSAIVFDAAENYTPTNQGTRMRFATTSIGATSITERMVLSEEGIIGLGIMTPNTSSLLDMTSTTRGFLSPRMTSAQRIAIGTPATGLWVYQTDGVSGFYFYNGSVWVFNGTGTGNDGIYGGSGSLIANTDVAMGVFGLTFTDSGGATIRMEDGKIGVNVGASIPVGNIHSVNAGAGQGMLRLGQSVAGVPDLLVTDSGQFVMGKSSSFSSSLFFDLSIPNYNVLGATAGFNTFITTSDSFAQNIGGGISFGGKYDSGGNITAFGVINTTKENSTDGNTDGIMRFYVRGYGTALTINSSGFSGFGTDTPTAKIDIVGEGSSIATTSLSIENSAFVSSFIVSDNSNSGFAATPSTTVGEVLTVKGAGTGNVIIGQLAGVTSIGAIGVHGSLSLTAYTLAKNANATDVLLNVPTAAGVLIFREANTDRAKMTQTTFNISTKMKLGGAGNDITVPLSQLETRSALNGTNSWSAAFHDTTTMAQGVGGGVYFTGNVNGTSTEAGLAAIRGVKSTGILDEQEGDLVFYAGTNGNDEFVRIKNTGNVGIGIVTPTAILNIAAGTAAASSSPLKFTTGVLMTVAETGAMEFASDFFYLTANAIRTAISTFGRSVDNIAVYAALITDRIIGVTRTSTGTATINLPSAALYPDGYQLTIMDEGLNASTNNITIDASAAQTINGNLTEIINVDGDSRTIYSNGVDGWFIM